MTAALQSLIEDGIKEWYLSCPAVSQNCILSTLLSTLMVLNKRSSPIVG